MFMVQKTITLLFSTLLIINGCARVRTDSNNQSVNSSSSKDVIPVDTLIILERTGCFGTCPIYIVTATADGTVIFEGKDYVKSKGRVESKISQEQLRELITEIERAGYFSLKDRYSLREDGCQSTWTDNPWAKTTIRINGRTKTIDHYYGCRDQPSDQTMGKVFPRELYELENKIDEIVGTKQWIQP